MSRRAIRPGHALTLVDGEGRLFWARAHSVVRGRVELRDGPLEEPLHLVDENIHRCRGHVTQESEAGVALLAVRAMK